MLDMKKTNILLAMAGVAALMASSPVLAQDAAAPAASAPAASAAAPAVAPAADAVAAPTSDDPTTVADAATGVSGTFRTGLLVGRCEAQPGLGTVAQFLVAVSAM